MSKLLSELTNFNSNRAARKRTLVESNEILKKASRGSSIEAQRLVEYSTLLLLPVLHQFPLLRVHESVGVYSILRFEPAHTLAPGLSKMVKECLLSHSSDPDKKPHTTTFRSGQPKHYHAIKSSVLKVFKLF